MTVGIVFSLDYEIHGNGEGASPELMVGPTWRLLRQFDRHGARLTIFAEVAEILRFRDHARATGRDDFHYQAIADQLRYALQRGHDVQLHIHPAFMSAVFRAGRWQLNWSEYDLAQLPLARVISIVQTAKDFLEELLQPVQPDFRVYAFRAGNWAMMPTTNAATALSEADITVDSSVFKGGRREDTVRFDYTTAPSEALPWRFAPNNVCTNDPTSTLWEFPIYCEMRPLWAFFGMNRLYRVVQTRLHPQSRVTAETARGVTPPAQPTRSLFTRHPQKADFNQCSSTRLIAMLKRLSRAYDSPGRLVPFVTIGHSKLYTQHNARDLDRFLDFVDSEPERYRYCRYIDLLLHWTEVSSSVKDNDSELLLRPGIAERA
jgi:hypothetical protein